MAELVYRYPLLLDAMASEMQRKGDAMMSKWAEIMTNMQVCVCLCVGGGVLSCCCWMLCDVVLFAQMVCG